MADAVHRLALILEAKNEAKKELQQAQQKLSELDRATSAVRKGLDKTSSGLGAFGRSVGGANTDLHTMLGTLGQVVPSLASLTRMLTGVGLVTATIGLVKKVGELGIAIDDVSQSSERAYRTFQRLAQTEAPGAMDRLRDATRGAADDQALMAGATQFLTMHLADTVEEATTLAEIATQLGMAMNHPQGPTGAMSDFALMLANQSIMRLDQFGLSSGRVRQRIEELTEANKNMTRETAFMTAVLEEAEVAMARVGEQAPTTSEALDAMWSNLKRNLLTAMGQTEIIRAFGLGDARQGLLEFGQDASEMFGRIAESGMRYRQFQEDIETKYSQGAVSLTQANEMLARSTEWYDEIARGALGPEELERRIESLVREIARGWPTMEQWTLTLDGMAWAARDATVETEALTDAQIALRDVIGSESYQAAKKTYEMAQLSTAGQLAYLRQLRLGMAEGSEEWLRTSTEIISIEKRLESERTASAKSGYDSIEAVAEEHSRRMRAMAEELLRPTSVTPADMFRAQTGALGGYVDKWDESARRLEDIANRGAASPWWEVLEIPEEVLAQGEEAVRLWARETADAVQRGVRPDLIDWEAFDRAAEEFMRDQEAREQTVAMAMQRLGGTAPESDVRAMLGMPADATQEAMAVGEAFQQGLGAVDMARAVTERFHEQMQAQMQRWVTMGSMTVTWFAQGLEEGVGDDTGLRIAKKLWPMIAPMIDNYLAQGVWN